MTEERDNEFRPVNQILGTQPSLGPIPADQIIPWIIIALVSYFIINGFFGGLFADDWQKWLWTVLIAGWGIITWWILTGGRSWRFLSKFIGVPTWTRGIARYQSFLGFYYERKNRKTKRKSQRSRR
jgi:purine-cytosine permease-like protein